MSEPSRPKPDRGVAESLRAAIQQTLEAAGRSARSGPALTRERAGELLDEVARRGRGARDELGRRGQATREELTRRGQDARGELSRRGQDAREEVARRFELLEKRLAAIEDALRRESQSKPED
jgi:polyhydroxyalkanoate synthesis regulator phasin